jgi:hypothetical protein
MAWYDAGSDGEAGDVEMLATDRTATKQEGPLASAEEMQRNRFDETDKVVPRVPF